MAEFLTCPWCGRSLKTTQEKPEEFRIELVDHDCATGHVRYTAWEEGYR